MQDIDQMIDELDESRLKAFDYYHQKFQLLELQKQALYQNLSCISN